MLKHRLSAAFSILRVLSRRMAKAFVGPRGAALVVVAVALLTMGAAHLKTHAMTRVWGWLTNTSCRNCDRPGARGASSRGAQSQGTGGTYTIIDAPGAGTSTLEGTIGVSINAAGNVAGTYLDSPDKVAHGFMYVGGTITEFNAPGAGDGTGQGTFALSIDAERNVAGMYADANNVYHGFLLPVGGSITEFDPPGAGGSTHRGTIPLSINAGVITGTYVTGSPTTTLSLIHISEPTRPY